ncbi:MAG: two-component sensor histidine kinase [Gammaproteobacteria bacterium]|nr:two-component sensor histidine kinase [Gammaproteobacteria bacterium]
MSSLSARLLLAVGVLLLFFFGATIVVLEIAFRDSAEQAQRDILDGHLMALLAGAEPNDAGELLMLHDLLEPRLGAVGSGLYGVLTDSGGEPVWESLSLLGLEIPFGPAPEPGVRVFSEVELEDGTPVMTLSLSVEWELANGDLRPYTFSVAESLDSFNAQLARYRRQLFGWFAAIALFMLLSMSLVMRGILKPLRQIEEEIGEIEEGRRAELTEGLPTELDSVARNMNVLIGSERGRAERYRHTLDNLAHSLKTPLAAIRAVLSEQPANVLTGKIEPQIERMNDIIRYQLRKPASLVTTASLGVSRVVIEEQLLRLVDGLRKVYKDKKPEITLSVDRRAEFRGDTGDFLELSGNLLDNACKWCKSLVDVRVRPCEGGGMHLTVSDDGPGIPEEVAGLMLERGMRLDESAPGHGIGLAVVREIAASYGGELSISASPHGGAEMNVIIPAKNES